MVEPVTENISAATMAAGAQEDNLLGSAADAELKIPAALDGNDSYEETQMNMNGFFCDNSD